MSMTETYERDGFVFPIRVMTEEKAAALRVRLEEAEALARDIPDGTVLFREYANIGLDFVGDLIKDPAVTDPVAEIPGRGSADPGLFVLYQRGALDRLCQLAPGPALLGAGGR